MSERASNERTSEDRRASDRRRNAELDFGGPDRRTGERRSEGDPQN